MILNKSYRDAVAGHGPRWLVLPIPPKPKPLQVQKPMPLAPSSDIRQAHPRPVRVSEAAANNIGNDAPSRPGLALNSAPSLLCRNLSESDALRLPLLACYGFSSKIAHVQRQLIVLTTVIMTSSSSCQLTQSASVRLVRQSFPAHTLSC